ncbi:hypothetical protein ACVIGB_000821 [Bradyrhizobium sp. USDA 4341]
MLGPIELEIHSGDGKILKLDPNTFVISAARNELSQLNRNVGTPYGKSFLSPEDDGWLYREDDFGVILTIEELRRLALRELLPDQYFRLRNNFGMFHSIHDDFYDELDGSAVQPKGILSRQRFAP